MLLVACIVKWHFYEMVFEFDLPTYEQVYYQKIPFGQACPVQVCVFFFSLPAVNLAVPPLSGI